MNPIHLLFPNLVVWRLALLTAIEIGVSSWLFWWLVNRFGRMDGQLRWRRCLICASMICAMQFMALIWIRLPMALPYRIIAWMFYINLITGLILWILGSLWAIRVTLNMPHGASILFILFVIVSALIETVFGWVFST